MLDADSLDTAIEGADYLVHVASPFTFNAPKHRDELVKPAVEGTLSALKAAHKHKLKRVVVTSSIIAIMMGHNPEPDVFTEEHWSVEERIQGLSDAYGLSKTLAEKAAWTY